MTLNSSQAEAAKEAMAVWLQNVPAVRQRPVRIRIAGEFDLHELHYYIVIFRMSLFQKDWFFGVAGGYEGDQTAHCGHVTSRMRIYDEGTAEQECIEMVEIMRSYWMKRGSEDGRMNRVALLQTEVLLKKDRWDRQAYLQELNDIWNLKVQVQDGSTVTERAVMITEGCIAAVIKVPAPLTSDQIAGSVSGNYLLHDDFDTAHEAHMIVRVNAMEASWKEAAEVFVRVTAGLCNENAAGVMMSGVLIEPSYYRSCALSAYRKGIFPVMNLVWVGVRKTEEGCDGWTEGMRLFGKKEMERGGKDRTLLRNQLLKAAQYVLSNDEQLVEGERIRLSDSLIVRAHIAEGKNVRDETVFLIDETEDTSDGRNE